MLGTWVFETPPDTPVATRHVFYLLTIYAHAPPFLGVAIVER